VLDDLLGASDDRTVVLVTHRTEGLGAVDRIVELTGQPTNRPAVPTPVD
jgi:ABC-type transport system involved in cytochrome bd biosynthesis fused ATPase/permease subunit